jgi:2-keto-myo-inositol isomerase
MKIALNGATTMHADLSTETNTVDDLKAELAAADIEPYSINSIEHVTFRGVDEYDSILAECETLSRIAGEIGCPYIVVVPGKLPANVSRDTVITESIRVLTELADIAVEHGVSLAFEFLGQPDCSVQTLDLAKEIVEKVDRYNVGLVIDSFHFYAGNSSFGAIDSLDPKKLFIFHINDAEDRPREELTDAHRLYPGEGILPLAEIKSRFDAIGYDRMVSIEIFRAQYWEQDPFEVARRAKNATEKVLGL